MSFEPILLAPEREKKEVYPYRRVWRSALIEAGVMLALTVAAVLIERFARPQLGDTQRHIAALAFALAPFVLWYVFSYVAERQSPQPRTRLFTVAILGALVANAIGVPLIERVFTVDDWLSTAPGGSRILGYALTAGIVQEFLKYAVVRYSVWPNAFRIRSDGIAYALAASVGYATVLNVNFALNSTASLSMGALRITELALSQMAISTIMGFFLAELKITYRPAIFWLPGSLLLAALLTGFAVTFRGGLVVGGVGPDSTGNNAFQGLGASVFLVIFLFATFNFLINNADERAETRRRAEFAR
ncbi:MAG: PrsW family intramembrane metalloprotease [Anaerolineae bacterium]|nr:PrsW family intramembrane metalloprotease [Anaerolineae bacterium]